jgi:hypothetical protein
MCSSTLVLLMIGISIFVFASTLSNTVSWLPAEGEIISLVWWKGEKPNPAFEYADAAS